MPGQSLLSTSKNTDSRLQVQLHPLVILTISDYVTRHTLRGQEGPIVGAIIGAQNGRDITMEHAFECKLEMGNDNGILVDAGWFHERLQQYRDVHKAQALDFVAWFTLAPPSGPQAEQLPIHNQFLQNYNESILLLALHPSSVSDGTSRGGKLPLTIYETVYEMDGEVEDKKMQSSGEGGQQLALRFQELPYTIETDEAEMIGVDFVARGGASAAVAKPEPIKKSPTKETSLKGKNQASSAEAAKLSESQANGQSSAGIMSPEDEELITSLTAKANAIRMLQQRLGLIRSYLQSLPPCYLNTPTPSDGAAIKVESHPQISHSVLRTVSSLLARLPLLTPTIEASNGIQPESFSPHMRESLALRTDVALTSMLGSMGTTLRSAQEMGRKAYIVEQTRNAAAAKTPSRRMGNVHGMGNMVRSGAPIEPSAILGEGEVYYEGEEEAPKEFGGVTGMSSTSALKGRRR